MEFEKKFNYPLGQDRFTISHGSNYFQFFNNIGETTHIVAFLDNAIVATVAMIFRNVRINNRDENVYYLCDLKILQEYRGKNIIQEFIKFTQQSKILLTNKFYSISMDDKNHCINRFSKITSRIKNLNLEYGGRILIYLTDLITINAIQSCLHQHLGTYEFKTLRGVKDLILQSTGQALNFVHLSRKTNSTGSDTFNEDDAKYMFCVSEGSELVSELSNKGLGYFATASILQKNMKPSAWDFITTGEL